MSVEKKLFSKEHPVIIVKYEEWETARALIDPWCPSKIEVVVCWREFAFSLITDSLAFWLHLHSNLMRCSTACFLGGAMFILIYLANLKFPSWKCKVFLIIWPHLLSWTKWVEQNGQPGPNHQWNLQRSKWTWQLFLKIKWHLHLYLSFGRKVIKIKGDWGFDLIEMKRPNLTNVIYPASDPLSPCVTGTEWLHFHLSAQRGLENDCRITTACYSSQWVTFSNPCFVNTPLLLIRFVIYIWFQSLLENFYCRALKSSPVTTIFMNWFQLKFEPYQKMCLDYRVPATE